MSIKDYKYFGTIELNDKTHCTCVIVSKNHVLTTAKCVENWKKSELKVRVGTSERESGGNVHEIDYITGHPNFTKTVQTFDIAVVSVKKSIDLNNVTIGVAELFEQDEKLKKVPITVVGFGMGGHGLGKNLKKYYNPDFQNSQIACLGTWAGRIELLDSQFCSGFIYSKGRISSIEDVGAPFISDGRVAGILSYFDSDRPYSFVTGEIYTKIASFRSWIDLQIA